MVKIIKTPYDNKNILFLSIILKSVIIIFSFIGFIITIIDAIQDSSGLIFTYFTIISNFFILVSTFIFLISDIGRYFNRFINVNRIFFLIRFCSLIAITITGCLFDFVLAPVGGMDLLASLDSVCFHVIVPFFSIIDFLVCNITYKIRWKDVFLSLVYPILYLIMIMILSYNGVRWDDGTTFAPYPFLDYNASTWFSKGEYLGVFYWIIILIIVFFLVASFYKLFQYLVNKKHLHIFR